MDDVAIEAFQLGVKTGRSIEVLLRSMDKQQPSDAEADRLAEREKLRGEVTKWGSNLRIAGVNPVLWLRAAAKDHTQHGVLFDIAAYLEAIDYLVRHYEGT